MSDIERPQPYIGVSGIGRYEQHGALVDLAIRERIDHLGYFMMIGIQATGKSQVLGIENKRGRLWHPVGDEIANVACNEDSGLTKPFIHCYFTDEEMAEGLANVSRRTVHYNQGMQFNGLSWVEKDYSRLLTQYAKDHPYHSIILQASSLVLDHANPGQLSEALRGLPVDYVLLDPSGGWGTRMDPVKIREYVDAIYQTQLPLGVSVSGGLDAQNMDELFAPLAEEYPSLSCDAEGRLRKGPEGATELDLELTDSYVRAWKRIVQSLATN